MEIEEIALTVRLAPRNAFFMQTRFLAAFIVAALLAPMGSQAARWPDVDIDLATCQVDTIIGGLKKAYDPKSFWVGQYVTLEMAIAQDKEDNPRDLCVIQHQNDKPALLECIGSYDNRRRSMIRCLGFTRTMCRQSGGFC